MNRVVIGGTKSGSGKTSVTCAILKALTDMGTPPAAFKCGPDYIDPMFHSFITGKSSYNLDSWMMEADTLRRLFKKNSRGSTLAVIEGVMGLYDGLNGTSAGSTAETAKILNAPVVLVMDGSGISTSIAAMLSGYMNYDRDTDIKGVIINGISGESHYRLLREIIERDTGVECLGYLPRLKGAEIKSRHLGLIPAGELKDLKEKISMLAREARKSINIKRILEIAAGAGEINAPEAAPYPREYARGLRIAVARDRAFNFYYQDNLNLMTEAGMELIPFSPLEDRSLPDGVNGLYLGGGYPEVFAEELSGNAPMREDIRVKASAGLPVYAECGGLMYLTRSITGKDGKTHPMAGFFSCSTGMEEGLKRFGYVEVDYCGIKTKGHEFHYSMLSAMEDRDAVYAYTVSKPGRDTAWKCGLSKRRVLAGYPHIHFYSNLNFFEKLVTMYKGEKL